MSFRLFFSFVRRPDAGLTPKEAARESKFGSADRFESSDSIEEAIDGRLAALTGDSPAG